MKTVKIQYFSDVQAKSLIHEYDTKEEATRESIQSWKEWMEDGATEHPEEPESYETYDVIAS